ncbi:MAG: glutathione peroxidase [Bradymonadia bacterium]
MTRITHLYLLWSLLLLIGCTVSEAAKKAALNEPSVFKDLELTMLSGQKMGANSLDGKVVLIVNVASQCGFTPQYKGLQTLYSTYQTKGLEIIAVPCNQFGGQEPGDPKEIDAFVKKEYGVMFPILSKQNVKGGAKGELFDRLLKTSVGQSSDVKWNFEKFLINRRGQLVDRFTSLTKPESDDLKEAIERLLADK